MDSQLPPFSTLDLMREDCFNAEPDKIIEDNPQDLILTEAEFEYLTTNFFKENNCLSTDPSISTYEVIPDIIMEDNLQNLNVTQVDLENIEIDYFHAYNTDATLTPAVNVPDYCTESTLTELQVCDGGNYYYFDPNALLQPPTPSSMEAQQNQQEALPAVTVEPVYTQQAWQLKEMTVDEYTASCFLTPPESICSEDENIVIVCSDKKTKISTGELKTLRREIPMIEKLIKPPSRRGRPRKKIELLQAKVKEAQQKGDTKKLKIARNNESSSRYRTNRTNKRMSLNEQLAEELAKFKELESMYTRLENEIRELKILQFANSF